MEFSRRLWSLCTTKVVPCYRAEGLMAAAGEHWLPVERTAGPSAALPRHAGAGGMTKGKAALTLTLVEVDGRCLYGGGGGWTEPSAMQLYRGGAP